MTDRTLFPTLLKAQADEHKDIWNLGGFSDARFELPAKFARGELGPDHRVGSMDSMAI